MAWARGDAGDGDGDDVVDFGCFVGASDVADLTFVSVALEDAVAFGAWHTAPAPAAQLSQCVTANGLRRGLSGRMVPSRCTGSQVVVAAAAGGVVAR